MIKSIEIMLMAHTWGIIVIDFRDIRLSMNHEYRICCQAAIVWVFKLEEEIHLFEVGNGNFQS